MTKKDDFYLQQALTIGGLVLAVTFGMQVLKKLGLKNRSER
tara:strand:+ start:308 stop:430 length:123 start_codon:yes stop_codon:yes gene_type:complete